MLQVNKIPIRDLNQHLTCYLCKGYLIDATAITECLHSFCKSCIVRYLETNKYCPICEVQVHKSKPLLNLKPDKIVQDIVYKLVPRLFQNEMQRRREFYETHPEAKASNLEQCGRTAYQNILTPDETICITLQYHGGTGPLRYLRCPAAVCIHHLKKLIRAKYDLTDKHRVEILFNQDCLIDSLSLMDVAYIYLWKRKDPIKFTYRIYEYKFNAVKVEDDDKVAAATSTTATTCNNNWKEVQLRISENGEMSVTGIHDDPLDFVNSDKYNKETYTIVETTTTTTKQEDSSKTVTATTTTTTTTTTTLTSTNHISVVTTSGIEKAVVNKSSDTLIFSTSIDSVSLRNAQLNDTATTACRNLSSATTTTVFTTTNKSKCSVVAPTPVVPVQVPVPATDSFVAPAPHRTSDPDQKSLGKDVKKTEEPSKSVSEPSVSIGTGTKRKLNSPLPSESPSKLPKTISNISSSIQNLSNNHPLKKHSQISRTIEINESSKNSDKLNVPLKEPLMMMMMKGSGSTPATSTVPVTSSQPFNPAVPVSVPGLIPKDTYVSISSESTYLSSSLMNKPQISSKIAPPVSIKPIGKTQPCYVPKSTCGSPLNIPKTPFPASHNQIKPDNKSAYDYRKCDSETGPGTSYQSPRSSPGPGNNNKSPNKAKPGSPGSGGYKTLRDPPKSWNSQIANISATKSNEQKTTDPKNAKPAKFFKMRNNMPRYLGNPASGVKPMFQVQQENSFSEGKSEIKKHSIIKIDPKTLKPISEKAPETTSLSNQSELKISTSSVSIFNPLKLQCSPKNDRKTAKNSDYMKSLKSPGSKRDKLNLSFTPANPFIPNLASPNINPNQFLYPSGPPGFPAYDPRVMAAYQNFLYGQRIPFPGFPGLNLDIQRNNYDLVAANSNVAMSSSSHSPRSNQDSVYSPTMIYSSPISKPQVLPGTTTTASPPLSKVSNKAKKSFGGASSSSSSASTGTGTGASVGACTSASTGASRNDKIDDQSGASEKLPGPGEKKVEKKEQAPVPVSVAGAQRAKGKGKTIEILDNRLLNSDEMSKRNTHHKNSLKSAKEERKGGETSEKKEGSMKKSETTSKSKDNLTITCEKGSCSDNNNDTVSSELIKDSMKS